MSDFVISAGVFQVLIGAWIPGKGCVITKADNTLLAVVLIYDMAFNFIILSLTAYKVFFDPKSQCRLMTRIFNDGLIYFLIAWVPFVRFPQNHPLKS